MVAEIDYDKLFRDSYAKYMNLVQQRDEINAELDKLRQFLYATSNMLSDETMKEVAKDIELIWEMERVRDTSLVEAIRKVLSEHPTRYFTVRQMRDALKTAGFDFTQYTANPLASISTTLKRMKSKEVTVTDVEGVRAYRKKSEPKPRNLVRLHELAKKLE
jgi:phosphoglycolate phosphatase-like HAD superfamily hydrolase